MADRWATFDCYGTLIDWEEGIAEGFARLWPDADRTRVLADFAAVEPRVQHGRSLPYREVLTRTLVAVAAIHGRAVARADEDLLARSLPSWPPFPDSAPALEELRRRGWSLAILSNTDPDLLAASIDAIGVPVDFAVTAAEAGSYKPAPGHWERFFAETGASRDLHVHVAASPFHDIEPAAGLGLTAVWINRRSEGSDLRRAAELPDLTGLADVLDRLVPRAG